MGNSNNKIGNSNNKEVDNTVDYNDVRDVIFD